jgi:hypothetical protein
MPTNQFEQDLIKAAAEEMWFDPHDDRHFTIVPARFNRLRGDRVRVNLGYTDHYLPDSTNRYVVYGLGQQSSVFLGLEYSRLEMLRWIRLDEVARENEMVVNVHIAQRQLPLSSIYIRRNERMQITLAVNAQVNEILLETEQALYLRVFSNDWLQEQGQHLDTPIDYVGGYLNTVDEAGPVITRWRLEEEGHKLLFHNGYYVNDISASELQAGDTLALHVDKSGMGYIDLPINDLMHYYSELDQANKWLVSLNLDDPEQAVPADELDIYLVGRQANVGDYPRFKGIFFSRIQDADIRQLTHQDFGVDSRRVEALIQEHWETLPLTEPFFRIFFRKTTDAVKRFPQVDGQHTLDLYRVDEAYRRSLMVGTGSTFTCWQPTQLEQSAYMQWQNAVAGTLSLEALAGLYSYDEVNRRVLEGHYPESHFLWNAGIQKWNYRLPWISSIGCLVLGYDVEGILIEVVRVPEGSYGSTVQLSEFVKRVRCIPGDGRETGDGMDRDTDYITEADWFGDQYYWRAVPSENWHPAFHGVDYTVDQSTGTLTWLDHHKTDERMRRTIRDSIYRDLSVDPELLYHPFSIYSDEGPATLLRLSHLEIYLDGRRLVEGIDFKVDYPNIQLYTKEYHLGHLNDRVRVQVFHYGLPDQTDYWAESGFVRNRRMVDGKTTRFSDLRFHTLVVDGKLSSVDDWDLTERPEQSLAASIREGGLYYRETPVRSLSEWVMERYGLVQETESDASRLLYPILERPYVDAPVFITHAHAIHSPFVYRTVQRIRDKVIDVARIGLSRGAAVVAMHDYLGELEGDVLSEDLEWNMIDVHPCPANEQIQVTEDEFMFLRILNELYFHKRLVFNTYFNVVKA